ncbi:MAG: ABC transporter ATP-binding protein [Rhodospirillales bacterium]|jgi:branched-chain amino acid transport system ATP-binding protein|nr:ABC transporter ATP-binding protein [Rhodospirillales bacterium]MBT4007148.1 ABC transporter ATP-binding protein [Rhodospirillales bacterium]MBT5113481.1 ABC transporter ATP-binding protein [Rhodospirillales bacterium]MBT5673779.1 ABC transporter ATP-binding protein [Rhodospirillales bacterium]MBT6186437.1 ABC transporter ATP-binding protein [Rhodospirillales bacterium]
MSQPLLSVNGVQSFYGPIQALNGVDLEIREGEIVTLIGANGAGKSTLLMTICGNPRARAGKIMFDGMDITNHATHEIARLGIAHVPEGRRIFAHMTVLENLLIGATPTDGTNIEADSQDVFELFPILEERKNQRGGTLSGGEQQMLAIGRALMSRPRLLLLDEPSLGLAPLVVRDIFKAIQDINKSRAMTVFLVEQNAYHGLGLADRAYVMANGEIQMTGTGKELLSNENVRAAYLEGGHSVR